MSHRLARLAGVVALVGGVAACASPAPPSETAADELVDGYAIGPARAVSGEAFHRLEVTARDVVNGAWPGSPLTAIQLVSAGTLADGSVQAGTEGPYTFLVMIQVHDVGRHALLLQCDEATFPQVDSCTTTDDGS